MAVGWWSTVMAGAGGQPSAFIIQAGSRIAIVDAGSIPTAAGIGIQIMPGVRRSTMGAGFTTRAPAGVGIPIPSGHRRGSHGVIQITTADGHRCRHARPFRRASELSITAAVWAWASISGWAQVVSPSYRRSIFVIPIRVIIAWHRLKWRRFITIQPSSTTTTSTIMPSSITASRWATSLR